MQKMRKLTTTYAYSDFDLKNKSFKEIKINGDYRTPLDNITKDFLIPILESSVSYCRATGFFTSESLIKLSEGIGKLAEKRGIIKIITSPKLKPDDFEAISKGYDIKQIISDSLVREIERSKEGFDEERLNLLANLVADGTLNFKIAFMESDNGIEIFHPKFGIFEDHYGDKIAFNGSMNETGMGFSGNFEWIQVFKSWNDHGRVLVNQELFDNLWNNDEPGVNVLEFPEAAKKKIRELIIGPPDYKLDSKNNKRKFRTPEDIQLRNYQKDAIERWENSSFRGIFNMATGTGKTITALAALDRLYQVEKDGLVTIIVCPLKHHVEQWADNIRRFGIEPIIGHSTSKHKDWKSKFDNKIRLMNIDSDKKDNICLITTNSSYFSNDVQRILRTNMRKSVLIVDEVHNIGKKATQEALDERVHFRLGLSATVERYKDKKGTDSIMDYFGGVCIEYGLQEAINEGMLVPYFYHPIPCYMTDEEYDEFTYINYEIEKIEKSNKTSMQKLEEMKELEIRGVRLMARMVEKFEKLFILAQKLQDESHLLVYCGATRLDGDDDNMFLDDRLRAIDKATQILGGELRMKVSQFTYKEDIQERVQIIEDFSKGLLQALIAIRCLDEGVDIPAIKTAILLSSSANPKEYIQRRGRVLRRFPGKEHATIFDLIALPKNIHQHNYVEDNIRTNEIKYISREIKRMLVFSEICLNPEETNDLIDRIERYYEIPDLRGYANGS